MSARPLGVSRCVECHLSARDSIKSYFFPSISGLKIHKKEVDLIDGDVAHAYVKAFNPDMVKIWPFAHVKKERNNKETNSTPILASTANIFQSSKELKEIH